MGDAFGAAPPAVLGWGLLALGAYAVGCAVVEWVRRG